MTGDNGSPAAPTEYTLSPPAVLTGRLAKWSYRLACLGPLAFLFQACMLVSYRPSEHPDKFLLILLWGFCLLPAFGIGLGLLALIQIRRSIYYRPGTSHSIAGIVVGLLASLSLFYGTQNLNESYMSYGPVTKSMSCLSNLRQLSTGFLMYAQDWDDRFPSKHWNDVTLPYIKNPVIYHCPAEEVEEGPSYAMNFYLRNIKGDEISAPSETVLVFDSVPGKNQAGGIAFLSDPPRHTWHQNIAFADGHVKAVPVSQIESLLWKPKKEVKPKIPHK